MLFVSKCVDKISTIVWVAVQTTAGIFVLLSFFSNREACRRELPDKKTSFTKDWIWNIRNHFLCSRTSFIKIIPVFDELLCVIYYIGNRYDKFNGNRQSLCTSRNGVSDHFGNISYKLVALDWYPISFTYWECWSCGFDTRRTKHHLRLISN